MVWATLGNVIWILILFPIIWVVEHIVALLLIVLAPLYHLLQYTLHAASIPFRYLAKFETVYIFFGTAVLLGLLTGIILYATSHLLGPVLGLNRQADEPPRTAASYRAERAERKAREAQGRTAMGLGTAGSKGSVLKFEDSDWNSGREFGPPTPMMGTMILEEGSSSE